MRAERYGTIRRTSRALAQLEVRLLDGARLRLQRCLSTSKIGSIWPMFHVAGGR